VLAGLLGAVARRASAHGGNALLVVRGERRARAIVRSAGISADGPATRTIASVQTEVALADPLESQTIAQAKRTRSVRIARDRLRPVRTIASF
jgi:hypothetical protein